MHNYTNIISYVLKAKGDIRQSIQGPALRELLDAHACALCADYLKAQLEVQFDKLDLSLKRELAGRLLLILVAITCGDEYDRDEALCLMGTRGVDAYGASRRTRLKLAAQARRKPLNDGGWYVRARYLQHTEKRLAAALEWLMSQPTSLRNALATHGEEAIVKYL